MKHHTLKLACGTLFGLLLVGCATSSKPASVMHSPGTGAHDWPQHGRTIYRNMVSDEKGLPDSFRVGDEASPSSNIKWVAPLGKIVLGVPVIANGKVYISSYARLGNDKYPFFETPGPKLGALYCFDEDTGDTLWQFIGDRDIRVTAGQFGMITAPVVENNRLYLCGGRLHFICLTSEGLSGVNQGPVTDEAKLYGIKPPFALDKTDADIVWMFDITKNISKVQFHNAYSFTSVIYGDYIYVSTGNGTQKDGEYELDPKRPPAYNADTPCFMVLDKKTGTLVAVDDEKMGRDHLIHGNWGTPCVGMVKGKTQILFGGPNGKVYAFDPAPEVRPGEKVGTLKKVWSFDPNVHLGAKRRFEIFGAPVCVNNRAYFATSDDWTHKKVGGILVCVDATKTGDITRTGKIWEYRDIGISEGTVSIANGRVYAADLNGKVHCLDANTGKPYWVFDSGGMITASTVVADGKVYVGNHKGDFFIFKEGKELELLYRTNMKGTIIAPCSIANGRLYIVAGSKLYAIGS